MAVPSSKKRREVSTLLFRLKLLLGAILGVFVVSLLVFNSGSSVSTNTSIAPLISSSESSIGTTSTLQLRSSIKYSLRSTPKHLVLTTQHGPIRIQLRPDLSPESVQHIQQLVTQTNCKRCQFYRSEKGLLLQGVMRSEADESSLPPPVKGKCPPEFASKQQNCPDYDPNCTCHGPSMTMGYVGWAGGGVGPDFFITAFENKDTWWGQTHTVWGVVQEKESLDLLLNKILDLPLKKQPGMKMLEEPIDFQMKLE